MNTPTSFVESVETLKQKLFKEANAISVSYLKYFRDLAETKLKKIQENREAFAKLADAGIDFPEGQVTFWSSGAEIEIRLGFFAKTRAGKKEFITKLRAIRAALGCPIKYDSHSGGNSEKRTIRFCLKPEAYKSISILYEQKEPAKGKGRCRWVTKKEKVLVCGS